MFGVQTTGAANDIQRATALARNMVTQYGMSEKFGLMSTASVENQYLNGQAYMDCSQETAAEVDKEVMEILQKAYADAKRILTENRGLLDEISEFLLVKETITGDELMAYVQCGQERSSRSGKDGRIKNSQQPRRVCRGCFSKSGFQVMK